MRRKKPAQDLNLDISNNQQPTNPGYKKEKASNLYKYKNVDAVMMNGVLEQLDGIERIHFMKNLYDCLKPGGKAFCTVSHWSNPEAVMSPYSKWPPLCPESFGFFDAEVRKRSNYYDDKLDAINFDVGWVEMYAPEWGDRADKVKEFAVRHYNNVLKGFAVTLTKREK